MRQLKDYSSKDNTSYLRSEHKDIYDCLKGIVSKSATRFNQIQETVDARDEFDQFLNGAKIVFPQMLAHGLKDTMRVMKLSKDGHLKGLWDIFEVMLLNKIDEYEFSTLDPEIKELYLKAQEIIDKESKDDSE